MFLFIPDCQFVPISFD